MEYRGMDREQRRRLSRRERDELDRARLDRIAEQGPVGDAIIERMLEEAPSRRDNTSRWIFALALVLVFVLLAVAT